MHASTLGSMPLLIAPLFTISSICATVRWRTRLSGSLGSVRMPWVSETTTSFSAFIAAATAPAAVSALTLSLPPAWSRAIVAMHGDRVGLHEQLQQPGVHALDLADQPEVDPPAVLALQVGLLGEQHDAGQRVQPHRLAALALDEVDDELVDLVAQHVLGDRERALVGVAAALTICGTRPAFSIASLIALPPPCTRTGCMPT